MSGHNPHSRVNCSQPVNSSSWNHLQVPSYIPRQPQLAHMSSERPIHSSSMLWPNTTPNPADAFYNYMALTAAAAAANSNHKNSVLDINPLLPFVRSTPKAMSFSSIDLSLPTTNSLATASLNNLLPSSSSSSSQHNQISPVSGSSSNQFTKLATNNEENGGDSTNNINSRLTVDSLAILNEMSGQLASMKSNINHNRDVDNYVKNFSEEKSKQQNEPIELIKDSTNDTENQTTPLFGTSSSSITPNLNDISKSLLSIFNNAAQSSSSTSLSTTSTLPLPPLPPSTNYHPHQIRNCSTASNDDSPDSQSGACNGGDDNTTNDKKSRYRRRKPQKTCRLANEFHTMNEFSGDGTTDTKIDSKDLSENVNGTKFSTYNTGMNNILASVNSILQPTQTQSMDLSQHAAVHDNYENGFHSQKLDTDKMDAITSTTSTSNEKNRNGLSDLPADDLNGLNLFSSMNYNHLRNNNLTNEIGTFPNTDDLVKKVEELVKCNETNGLNMPAYEPIELTKPHPKISNHIDDIPATISKNNGNEVINVKPINFDDEPNNCHEIRTEKLMAPILETVITDLTPTQNTPNHQNGDDQKNLTNDNGPLNTIDANQSLDMSSIDRSNESKSVSDNDRTEEKQNENIEHMDCTMDTDNEKSVNVESNNTNIAVINEPTTSNSTNSSNSTKSKTTTTKKSTASRTNNKNRKNGGKTNKRNTGNSRHNLNNKNNHKNLNNKLIERTDKSDIKKETDTLAKFRGPYVHIERNGSQVVINTPLTEETAEKQSKFKKSFISQTANDRNRIRGLHISTLSNKYDAVTTDISWMCVFCKLGPHKYGLGDLFGPFILSTESEDFQLAQIDTNDDAARKFRCKSIPSKGTKSTTKSTILENIASSKKKRKLSQLNDSTTENGSTSQECSSHPEQTNGIDIFYGMTKASEHAYEVWVHEDCVVWSSGVHIIGARVVGLETAVWDSVRHQCVICKHSGAVLSCLHRSCEEVVHAPCAKRHNWILDERTFQSRCPTHGNNEQHSRDCDESNNHKQN